MKVKHYCGTDSSSLKMPEPWGDHQGQQEVGSRASMCLQAKLCELRTALKSSGAQKIVRESQMSDFMLSMLLDFCCALI